MEVNAKSKTMAKIDFSSSSSNSTWQDLRPRERMEHLLSTGHLSDCSFVVYDEDGNKVVFKCHKFILISASPVFERMFVGDFEEAKMPENIVLDDVSGNDFKKFIEYLYWHDNRRLDGFELETLQTLIYLSKKFMVTPMTNNCLSVLRRRLANGLDPDLTVDMYEYVHQIEDKELITAIELKFRTNAFLYINTAAVFELSSEIFLCFIQQFKGVVGDKNRFDVIDRYCRIQGLVEGSAPPTPEKNLMDMTNSGQSPKRVKPMNNNGQEISKEADNNMDENQNKMDNLASVKEPNEADDKTKREEEAQKKRQANKRNEYIAKLLATINFRSMTPYNFCRGPGTSNLLSVETKYEFLSKICVAEHKLHLLAATKEVVNM